MMLLLLAQASVGIAMGAAGSDALETADVAFDGRPPGKTG